MSAGSAPHGLYRNGMNGFNAFTSAELPLADSFPEQRPNFAEPFIDLLCAQ
ncbi:hypothetical protein PAECIP111802_06891 [Paenibacillus allorhizosphaerae]|uniref:Uncharacterized protein n=1 Tax=Paenibacillus allorhizosphaerae TaxID=2849866 RepID=A0ABM8VTM8_9BACL|nr:hypothetical protein PAECIP111802_06891 [Paenibacillus allorhizosphaerae]